MAGPKTNDPYRPVPTVNPNQGMPPFYLQGKASAEDFGAGIAKSLQNLGAAGSDVADVLHQQQKLEQGMINETLATDGATSYNKLRGELMGGYKSLQGLAAVDAAPKVSEKLLAIRQELRSKMPNDAAARAFDSIVRSQEAYSLSEIGEYKAQQIKAADRNSARASMNTAIAGASSTDVANNDILFGQALGDVQYQVARIVENLGYITRDEKGNAVFSSPEGKAVYDDYNNKALSRIWDNRLKTLAYDTQTGSIKKAVDTLVKNQKMIPPEKYAEWSARLHPAYRGIQARDIADGVLSEADSEYKQGFTASNTSDGTVSGMSSIVTNLFPGAVVTSGQRSPEKNKKVGGAKNSFHIPGQAIDFVKPEGMTFEDVKRQLELAGVKPTELLDEGDHIHLAWGSKKGFQNQADYLTENYDSIIENTRRRARELYPDDPTFEEQAVTRTEQRINDVLRAQQLSNSADQTRILQAVNGKTGGAPFTNIEQLENSPDPELREAWGRFQLNNPVAAERLERNILTANSRGAERTYGVKFYQSLEEVLSGELDDPSEIMARVRADLGPNSDVTNTGYKVLLKELESLQTPEGRAFAKAQAEFLSQLRGNFTSKMPGIDLPEFNKKFEDALVTILPRIAAGRAKGIPPGQLFDPDSKDYVGFDVKAPTAAELSKAQAQAVVRRTQAGLRTPVATTDYKSAPEVITAYQNGKISYDDAAKILVDKFGADDDRKPEVSNQPPPVPFRALEE